jgi:hypothetical protein
MNDLQMISEKGTQTATPFSADSEKGRGLFAALGLAINKCLGSTCSWSLIRAPLQKLFSVDATASLLPFIVSLRSLPF